MVCQFSLVYGLSVPVTVNTIKIDSGGKNLISRTGSITKNNFFKNEESVISLVIRAELVVIAMIVYRPRFLIVIFKIYLTRAVVLY